MLESTTLSTLSPAELRWHQAKYFLGKFRESCGSPQGEGQSASVHCHFLWVTYADAFLMALVSVEELVSDGLRQALLNSDQFRVLKALRNATTHHTVVASPKYKYGAQATHSMHHNIAIGGRPHSWVVPKIRIENLRALLSRLVRKDKKHWKNHTLAVRRYLRVKKADGLSEVDLAELFEAELLSVARICRIKERSP